MDAGEGWYLVFAVTITSCRATGHFVSLICSDALFANG